MAMSAAVIELLDEEAKLDQEATEREAAEHKVAFGPERLRKLHDEHKRRHEFECGVAQALEQHFNEYENGFYDLERKAEAQCLREYEFECMLEAHLQMDKWGGSWAPDKTAQLAKCAIH